MTDMKLFEDVKSKLAFEMKAALSAGLTSTEVLIATEDALKGNLEPGAVSAFFCEGMQYPWTPSTGDPGVVRQR